MQTASSTAEAAAVPAHPRLPGLALAALGVVYGDIGTSPIYAFRESVIASGDAPQWPSVAGLLSLIFWVVTIIVSFKYASLILRADNRGQGGMLALVALALQKAREPKLRYTLLIVGVAGAALFLGDAVITPAISVLSAVEGLELKAPGLAHFVIPVTIVIVIGLFAVQSHGSGAVGRLFGPIMLLWFGAIALLGLVHIVQMPSVLLALNPLYAFDFMVAHAGITLAVLGSVLLAVTGGEALYADLGHFGRKPIQVSWFSFVLPACMLNYFGQGALVMKNPAAVSGPFFLLAPDWLLLPLVVLATLATVIASQAVISGAFSLGWQAMRLGMCPRLMIRHTSASHHGQIYAPHLNWLLMICVILLVIGFKSSGALASAYGIAVTGTMIINTVIAFLVSRWHWRWPLWKSIAAFGIIILTEGTLLTSSLLKIPQGGWFPLALGGVVFLVMATWMRGRALIARSIGQSALTEDEFLGALSERRLTRVPGTVLFLTGDSQRVPFSLLHNMRHNRILHERIILTSLVTEDVPFVPEEERVEVRELGRGFWRLIARYGFVDEPDISSTLRAAEKAGLKLDPQEISFFVGRERIVARAQSRMAAWRLWLFTVMSYTETSAADYFRLPAGRVIELGARIEV
ncbi:MAG TPA: potassium transporter Kup [Dongiaceae bacterium]|jgi:KUP system potassium uptake protein|nr:potassium transporter Kup [Dongiaceae bacterium]